MRHLIKVLLILGAVLVAMPALAQQGPPARVGRVSVVEGNLAFYGPDDTDWSAATANFPVAENGWFATDDGSRAEFRIGAASVFLDHNGEAGFTLLRDRNMQLALAQGRADLHLRQLKQGDNAEVDTARGGVWMLQPGEYDIDGGDQDRPTRITVFDGSAHFAGGGIDVTVKAGDTLIVTGTDQPNATVEPAAVDEFVRWCRSHDYQQHRLAAPYHISPAMTGYEELDSYGQWAEAPDYGEVWYPSSVPADWAPYREGHWVWIEPWGWTWVDDEPWGFAPFHYGRWAHLDDRWAWVPGRFVPEPVYAPALVAFVAPSAIGVATDAEPAVGWFPLAPGEVYWPSYTRDRTYIRNVNVTNVNVTVINNITRVGTATNAPPAQVAHQRFANSASATVVPAAVMTSAAKVAPAAVKLPPQVLQAAAVTVHPPKAVAPPPVAPRPSNAPAASAQTGAGHPAIRPNFSHLAPAPQLARPTAQPAAAATPAPGAHPPSTEPRPGEAAIPLRPGGRPPGSPDFLHLAPAHAPPASHTEPAAAPAGLHPGVPPSERAPPTVLRPTPRRPPAFTGPPGEAGPRPLPPGQAGPPRGLGGPTGHAGSSPAAARPAPAPAHQQPPHPAISAAPTHAAVPVPPHPVPAMPAHPAALEAPHHPAPPPQAQHAPPPQAQPHAPSAPAPQAQHAPPPQAQPHAPPGPAPQVQHAPPPQAQPHPAAPPSAPQRAAVPVGPQHGGQHPPEHCGHPGEPACPK